MQECLKQGGRDGAAFVKLMSLQSWKAGTLKNNTKIKIAEEKRLEVGKRVGVCNWLAGGRSRRIGVGD